MIKIKVLFGNDIIDSEWQTKTFKDEMMAVEWCRRNYLKIWRINDYPTHGELMPHFQIMDAIKS